MEPEEK
ncbi:hypothetical protein RDI58_007170 [Solanum bulbocastanum]